MTELTREQWLNKLADRLNGALFKGQRLGNFRVSVSWPGGRGKKNSVIGQCWSPEASSGGVTEMFISPTMSDPMRVAGVLAHEMVHGIVGVEHGHDKHFGKLAREIGLEGKLTATTEGEAFKAKVQPILDKLPAYPHHAMNPGLNGKKKQSTRLIKCECPECGYNVRVTRKWLEVGLPGCPEHGEMEVAL